MTAGVLAGALLVGGAAGVGGAAWYNAWNNDPASASTVIDTGSGATASTAGATTSVEQVAAKVLPSVVKINVTGSSESGSGSGIVLNKAGDILTNNHVAAVAGKGGTITVNFNNGDTEKATIVGTDAVTDLAVIRVSGTTAVQPAVFGKSSALKVGQDVVAVGSPYGLNATVTSGIVSALNRPVSVQETDGSQGQSQGQLPFGFDPFGGQSQTPQSGQSATSTTYPAIQTDAAINPGNSGGPLVNLNGEVVGINSSIYSTTSGSGQAGSIGLGFAIPIDEAMPIVRQIIAGETPTHARLGVTVGDIQGSSLQQGAKIASVDASGAGASVGLKPGDVITKVDNEVVDSADSLVATIRGHRPGQTVRLTYVRGGAIKQVSVKLGSDAHTTAS